MRDDWGHRDLGDCGAREAAVKAARLTDTLKTALHWAEVVESAASSSMNGWALYSGDVLACLGRVQRLLPMATEAFVESATAARSVYYQRRDKIPEDDQWRKDGESTEVQSILHWLSENHPRCM